MSDEIVIRSARDADAGFVAGLAQSLLEFGSPIWDDPEALVPGFRRVLADAVRSQDPRAVVLIAQTGDGAPLGFISLKLRENVAGFERAHVADLAVTHSALREGVGRALMQAGEAWAREREMPVLSLDIWSTNERALAFYCRLDYWAESLCLIKALDRPLPVSLRSRKSGAGSGFVGCGDVLVPPARPPSRSEASRRFLSPVCLSVSGADQPGLVGEDDQLHSVA